MRVIGIALVMVFGVSVAAAKPLPPPSGGGGDSRGRLGHVSVGMAGASKAGGAQGGSTRPTQNGESWNRPCDDAQYRRRIYDGVCVRRCPDSDLFRVRDGRCIRRTLAMRDSRDARLEEDTTVSPTRGPGGARFSGYLGAQKVFESDGAFALELAIRDRWFRVGGSLTRFYERQADRAALTLTVPTLAFGVRLANDETTQVYVEAGVAHATTKNDPMMDSSLSGVLGGVYAEHSLSKDATLVGSARLMGLEDDVRAASLRAGIRYKHVQASFSVLDFNVGPALFGPELGFAF